MTEDPEHADPVRTGVIHVDEVIAAVEELEQRPIEEHVGVFETAHEQLRRALDHPAAAPDQSSIDQSSSDQSSSDQSSLDQS
jgi:hypothetical protein